MKILNTTQPTTIADTLPPMLNTSQMIKIFGGRPSTVRRMAEQAGVKVIHINPPRYKRNVYSRFVTADVMRIFGLSADLIREKIFAN